MLRALVSLSLLAAVAAPPAHAAPPEGCIGFPDIPEAYVCITSFTPANAVPSVAPGPGQTYSIPRFCVFECFGPTPVTVPGVTVTPGSGLVATIVYDGTTYPVYVPPAATVEQTVQQAQTTVSNAVTAVLGVATAAGQTAQNTANGALHTAGNLAAGVTQTVEGADDVARGMVMTGEMRISSFGTGATTGTLTATAVGVPSGSITGSFSAVFSPSTCPITGSASGSLSLNGAYWAYFTWSMVGEVAVMTLSDRGTGMGTFVVTSHVGNPCGQRNVGATWNAVIAGA